MSGKIMIAEFKNLTKANMIDFGALINAILDPLTESRLIDSWSMSWTKEKGINISELSKRFFNKILNK
jgi:hypothetical protein